MIPLVMDMSCPYFSVVFTETSKEDKLPPYPLTSQALFINLPKTLVGLKNQIEKKKRDDNADVGIAGFQILLWQHSIKSTKSPRL